MTLFCEYPGEVCYVTIKIESNLYDGPIYLHKGIYLHFFPFLAKKFQRIL